MDHELHLPEPEPMRSEPAPSESTGPDRSAPREVTRSVEIDAPVEDVWDVVSDPERRADWLDDEDARSRVTCPGDSEPGRLVSWTWWRPDDETSVSHVEVTLGETAAGSTRVVVTERPALPFGRIEAKAALSATGRAGSWDYRLLGLELLCVVVHPAGRPVGVLSIRR